jgi:sec-independent protein translocase protein TatA
MIGATEILIIGGVVFVLFGATAIPKFAKSLGQAKKEFQKGVKEQEEGNDKEDEKAEGKEKNVKE